MASKFVVDPQSASVRYAGEATELSFWRTVDGQAQALRVRVRSIDLALAVENVGKIFPDVLPSRLVPGPSNAAEYNSEHWMAVRLKPGSESAGECFISGESEEPTTTLQMDQRTFKSLVATLRDLLRGRMQVA